MSPSCLLGVAEPRYVYQFSLIGGSSARGGHWLFQLKVEPLVEESNLRLGSQRKCIYIMSQSDYTRGTKRFAGTTLQSQIMCSRTKQLLCSEG